MKKTECGLTGNLGSKPENLSRSRLNSNFAKQVFCSAESYIKYVGETTGSKLFPVLISQYDN